MYYMIPGKDRDGESPMAKAGRKPDHSAKLLRRDSRLMR